MSMSDYLRTLRASVGHELIMIPTVAAVIRNDEGEILLQLRGDMNLWGLPGGAIDPGEEPAEALVREVLEETGLHVVPERLIGVYGGADNMGAYPNGDQYAMINISFACRVLDGTLKVDGGETLALRYFSPEALPQSILPQHRFRLEHGLHERAAPYFCLPG